MPGPIDRRRRWAAWTASTERASKSACYRRAGAHLHRRGTTRSRTTAG